MNDLPITLNLKYCEWIKHRENIPQLITELFQSWLEQPIQGKICIAALNEVPNDYIISELIVIYETFSRLLRENNYNPAEYFVSVYGYHMPMEKFYGVETGPVTIVNWFELQTYLHIQTHSTAKSWNSDNHKLLFKVGKLSPHRMAVLSSLISSDLMDKISLAFKLLNSDVWGYTEIQKSHEYMFGTPDIEYFREYDNDLDIDLRDTWTDTYSHYTGFPYGVTDYENTLGSIVCESHYGDTGNNFYGLPWMTEKSYLPIINKHPFILFAETNHIEFMQKDGYLTYNHLSPSMEHLSQTWTRQDNFHGDSGKALVAKCITEFMDALKNNPREVNHMVEHNYQNFMARGKAMADELNAVCENLIDTLFECRYRNIQDG